MSKCRGLKFLVIVFGVLFLWNCTEESDSQGDSKIFNKIDHRSTGIEFSNNLTENDSLNYFTYSYLYMGGGVATGDINNDGLADLFFTGNQVENKLYINKGNLKFEDITDKAGIAGDDRWYTGVTMGDVNGDGFLDIYCSVSGLFSKTQNQLYINNGDETFTERSEEYGVADIGKSTQATFFDYDKDGDLDLYVANYPIMPFNSPEFAYQYKMENVKAEEIDHLFRNDGGHFTDVSKESGVGKFGLSLSATVGDLNNDSWPDVYISNDFMSPDYMFINQKDGTFKEVSQLATSHTAFYGMGVDIADANNDGNLDIFQVDMDANTNRRKKANMASMNPILFWSAVNAGFGFQYMHNTFQMNSGVFDDNVPHFSNVSRLTGTSSTDWSWGPLFADFDNDGNKDLFVSNGTRREINNNDYFNKIKKEKLEGNDLLKLALEIPSEKIDNFIFRNNGDYNFEKANDIWGIKYEGFSNGVVYVDLDNDGDLEIVTNNIDDYVAVFENTSSNLNNFVSVKFEGNAGNQFGLGARVYVTTDGITQMQELTLTRGFQSSVAPSLHFGIGQSELIDKIEVVWPDGMSEEMVNLEVNQNLVFKKSNSALKESINEEKDLLFVTNNDVGFIPYKHEENEFDDFGSQILLPHKLSRFGPPLAAGDLNGDGKEDYFIGGSSGFKGALFYQTQAGFEEHDNTFLTEDQRSEDVGAMIFDADNDGDNDLYVVSGGYELPADSKFLQDRLYVNDGQGNFTKLPYNALPKMFTSGSKVYHADFDKDGKEDLLVLGRQIPKDYPKPASSYLLKNTSSKDDVKFENMTSYLFPGFEELGMATSAVIADINNDDWLDIIIVGEWMPIRVFQNMKTGFKEVSDEMGLGDETTGWWWSISEGDFDGDGDLDFIVGNNGLNYKYKATEDETFDIFVNDFDQNREDDIVLSYYNEGEQFPVRGRECSSQQIPGIKDKFENYQSFSEASLVDVYTQSALENALHYQVKSFASLYLENRDSTFIKHKLPVEAQMSSINKILVEDFDGDGHLDALIAGNMYASEVETPRNDAGYGRFLKGDGQGGFNAVPASESGFFTSGDVKDMVTISVKDKTYVISAKNDDDLQFIEVNNK